MHSTVDQIGEERSATYKTSVVAPKTRAFHQPGSTNYLWHAPPGVVLVVAGESACPLQAEQLEEAAGGTSILGGNHIRRL